MRVCWILKITDTEHYILPQGRYMPTKTHIFAYGFAYENAASGCDVFFIIFCGITFDEGNDFGCGSVKFCHFISGLESITPRQMQIDPVNHLVVGPAAHFHDFKFRKAQMLTKRDKGVAQAMGRNVGKLRTVSGGVNMLVDGGRALRN